MLKSKSYMPRLVGQNAKAGEVFDFKKGEADTGTRQAIVVDSWLLSRREEVAKLWRFFVLAWQACGGKTEHFVDFP